ncbi:MAG: hypothetical protein RSF40_01625 [Oscillospiraceae bacterium]
MEHKIEIVKVVTTDDIVNILSCEAGGFDYWAQLDAQESIYDKHKAQLTKEIPIGTTICYENILAHILEHGGAIDVCDYEEDEHYDLTLEKLLNGIKLNAINRPDDADIGNGDAATADCILQYAIFGDVIYG